MSKHAFLLPTRRQAIGELTFASALWGFGFIAARWALIGVGPLWCSSFRFLIAFACAIPFVYHFLRSQAGWEQFQLSAVPGILLGVTLLLPMYALQYTTVTRTSFINVLYVVFVPLFERLLLGKKISPLHGAWVSTALLGTGLICQVEAAGNWNRGDVLMLLCAVTSAMHILRLEAVAPKIESSFVFNVYQSFWAAVPVTVAAIFFEALPRFPIPSISWVGILILALVMTLVAFFLQVRSQRVLPPSLASMLFLLESPFAAIYAYLIFAERMHWPQWCGAALILVAALGSIRTQSNPAPATQLTIGI